MTSVDAGSKYNFKLYVLPRRHIRRYFLVCKVSKVLGSVYFEIEVITK